MEYLAEGKRGIVYTDFVKGKKVCIKIEKRGLGRVDIECRFLNLLNKYKIGPKLISCKKDRMVYEYADGSNLYGKFNKKIALDVLKQCYKMDKLGIDKFEMHHPWKHVISGKKVVMIDFERCKYSANPKNVTGFCQFLAHQFKKRIPVKILRAYKSKYSKKDFDKIVSYFKL